MEYEPSGSYVFPKSGAVSKRTINSSKLLDFILKSNALETRVIDLINIENAIFDDPFLAVNLNVKIGLKFKNCTFKQPVVLRGSSIDFIEFDACQINGADFRRLSTNGSLRLLALSTKKTIYLGHASIGTNLEIRSSKKLANGAHFNLQRISVGGSLIVTDSKFYGEVSLKNALILGQLNIDQVQFNHLKGYSLNAQSAEIRGALIIESTFAKSGILLSQVSVSEDVIISKSEFTSDRNLTVTFQNAYIGGAFKLFEVNVYGGLSLHSSEVVAQIVIEKCSFIAVSLDAIILQDISLEGRLTIKNLTHTPVGGINLSYASIRRINIDDTVFPMGRMELSGLNYFSLDYPEMYNRNSVWEGWLSAINSKNPYKIETVVDKLIERIRTGNVLRVSDKVDLKSGMFPSDLQTYAAPYLYKYLETRRKESQFSPEPWRKLATILEGEGKENIARILRVQLSRRMTGHHVKRLKQTRKFPLGYIYRLWRWVYRATTGFGFTPWRSLLFLTYLYIVGATVFALCSNYMTMSLERVYLHSEYRLWEMGDSIPEGYIQFNPYIYTLDLMLPFIELSQQNHWQPKSLPKGKHNHLQVFTWLFSILGWTFSTIALLGFTGLVHDRRDP